MTQHEASGGLEWIRGWVMLLHPLGWATPARRLRLGMDHTAWIEPSPVSPHRVSSSARSALTELTDPALVNRLTDSGAERLSSRRLHTYNKRPIQEFMVVWKSNPNSNGLRVSGQSR